MNPLGQQLEIISETLPAWSPAPELVSVGEATAQWFVLCGISNERRKGCCKTCGS